MESTSNLLRRAINIYGYTPTKWIAILFVVLFSMSTIGHVYQSIRYKTYFMLITAGVAGLLEVLGWSGRIWSSQNPYNLTGYLMQNCTTILAPTYLLAANFVIFGHIISKLGPQYNRLPPTWYTIIFCSFDVISLIVQAIGGAKAAASARTKTNPDVGGNIMLAGIVMQLIAIIVYVTLALEFFTRFQYDKPVRGRLSAPTIFKRASESSVVSSEKPTKGRLDKSTKIMLGALIFNTTCLVIRAIYRTIELSDGWNGRIIRTEHYFNILDGAAIVLALYTFNFFHPGYLAYRQQPLSNSSSI